MAFLIFLRALEGIWVFLGNTYEYDPISCRMPPPDPDSNIAFALHMLKTDDGNAVLFGVSFGIPGKVFCHLIQ